MKSWVDVRWVACAAVVATCGVACGGDDSGDGGDSSGRGGSVSSGGSVSTGGSSGGGMSNGGTSTGGSSSGSGGSSGSVDCTGGFGAARTVLEFADMTLSSLTLSPDELELLYSTGPTSTLTQGFVHARRTSKADVFSAPVPLPELDAACPSADLTRSGDLTLDGLVFYFSCYDSTTPSDMPLRVARRANLDAPFVVDPTPLGNVRGGPSVSPDELELFSAIGSGLGGMHYVRGDTSAPFSPGQPIAGLETFFILTPDIAADGVTLFASQSAAGATYGLVSAVRSAPSAAFGPLTVLIPELPSQTFGSAAISNDCRSLYYVHVDSTQGSLYRVEVVTR